jgi:hypothetical protein
MYVTENKAEIDLGRLQEDLEKQYGPAVAQDIVDRLRQTEGAAPVKKAPDYMDVKALSELAERFRAQAMMAVWRLREWRKAEDRKGCTVNLIELEGVFLQRQCEDAIILYRQANKSYWATYREAMAVYVAKPSGAYLNALYQREACA